MMNGAVGLGGANAPDDVRLVQLLLNQVPGAEGGTGGSLRVTGFMDPDTMAAIRAFQRRHFGSADGLIEPGKRTIAKLGTWDSPTPGDVIAPPPKPAPTAAAPQIPNAPGELSPLRKRILEIAFAAAKPPYGIVNDMETIVDPDTGERVRAGWRHLKRFMDEALANWSEQQWKDKRNWDGIRLPGKFMPGKLVKETGKTLNFDWCGVFDTWVFRQAGIDTKWVIGTGPSRLKRETKLSLLQPGDIANVERQNHHFIVAAIENGTVTSINGNSEYQGILVKQGPAISEIKGFYRVPD